MTDSGFSKEGLIYLACPYNHPSAEVRRSRFEAANRAAGYLMAQGFHVFSPISHTHPIAEAYDLPKGFDYWEQYDRMMIYFCTELAVLTIDGWLESVGVKAEIAMFSERDKKIFWISPVDYAIKLQIGGTRF